MPSGYITYAGPPNQGIYEVGQESVDVNGNTWLCTARGVAGQPGTTFLQTSTPPSGGGEVTSIVAGTGISVSSPAGAVTVTNAGVTSLVAGVNVAVSASDGAVTVSAASVGVITAPANSASVSASVNVSIQNTTGYDANLGLYLSVASASVATVNVGVGSASTPTVYPIVTGYTTAAANFFPITVYVPSGYYALVTTSGTISDSLKAQWFPV